MENKNDNHDAFDALFVEEEEETSLTTVTKENPIPQISNYRQPEMTEEVEEKINHIKHHFLKSIEDKGERRGILSMRRHFANYFKNLPNFREIKIQLLTSMNEDEIINILEQIRNKYSNIVFEKM